MPIRSLDGLVGEVPWLLIASDGGRLFYFKPVRFEFLTERFELAAAGGIGVTLPTGFAGLRGKFWLGVGVLRRGQRYRAYDQ